MTAKLPRALERATVSTMQVWETRWVRPSTMCVKPDRSLWLMGNSNAASKPGSYYTMRIRLTDEGYHVWPDSVHYYEVGTEEDFNLSLYADLVPVQELHEGEHR